MIDKPSKRDVLLELTVGSRVAEDEAEELAAYFVETDQWRKVMKGKADIILGPKGSGKSAIYSTLLRRSNELLDGNMLLISAENPVALQRSRVLRQSRRQPSGSSWACGRSTRLR